jgi:hypothetical protein
MHKILMTLLLTLLLPVSIGYGATVYKSVDEQGRTTFSDQPPAPGEAAEILTYDPGEPVSPEEAQQRLDRMRANTDRMAAAREEREAARTAADNRRRPPEPPPAEPLPTYYPVYLGGARRPPYHRPGHHHPGHGPGHRPIYPVAPVPPSAARVPYPASYIRQRYPGAAGKIFNPPARAAGRR